MVMLAVPLLRLPESLNRTLLPCDNDAFDGISFSSCVSSVDFKLIPTPFTLISELHFETWLKVP